MYRLVGKLLGRMFPSFLIGWHEEKSITAKHSLNARPCIFILWRLGAFFTFKRVKRKSTYFHSQIYFLWSLVNLYMRGYFHGRLFSLLWYPFAFTFFSSIVHLWFSGADGKQPYAVHWEPPPEQIYKWKNKRPKAPSTLRVYECHIGISGSQQAISSFKEFTANVINGILFYHYFLQCSFNLWRFSICLCLYFV